MKSSVCSSEDGVFVNARGVGPFGDMYSGKKEIREYFAKLFSDLPDLRYETVEPNWLLGDKAVFRWHRKATTRTGEKQDWLGCDLFTFEDGSIKRKDTYFKIIT